MRKKRFYSMLVICAIALTAAPGATTRPWSRRFTMRP